MGIFGSHPNTSRLWSWPSSLEECLGFGERSLTGPVFVDVAKTVNIIWVDSHVQANGPWFSPISCKTISSYLHDQTFEAPFQTATFLTVACWVAWHRVDYFSPRCWVCMSTTYMRHPTMSSWPSTRTTRPPHLVPEVSAACQLPESYLCDIERLLREWRIAIKVSKSTAKLFSKAGRRISKPRPVRLAGQPIDWVETARYGGGGAPPRGAPPPGRGGGGDPWYTTERCLILITLEWKLPRDWECFVLSYTCVVSPSETKFCCISCSSVRWWTTRSPSGGPLFAPMSSGCRCFNPRVIALLLVHLGTLITGKVTSICEFHSSPTTSEP